MKLFSAGDWIAIPFFSLFMAALARHNRLHLPQLQFRGGGGLWYQQHASLSSQAPLALPPGAPAPHAEPVVGEEDFYHLPLEALKVGVADSLAHQAAISKGLPFEPPARIPEFLLPTRASFFFGEANGTAFASLRALWGITDEDFMASFNSGFTIFTSNSRSRQFFCCTGDNRYMIKTMSREEIRALDAIMGEYWRHMAANPRSLIVQYCGHLYVRLYRAPGEAPEDVHFLVMRNLLREPVPGVVVEERYDVKGSTVGRAASEKEKRRPPKEQILKDLDLLQRPVPVDFGVQKGPFMEQVHRDLAFLRMCGVMDYSLLVGVCRAHSSPPPGNRAQHFSHRVMSALLGPPHDPLAAAASHPQLLSGGWMVRSSQSHEAYLCGIIDILQMYNTRKRAETLIKSVVHSKQSISAVDPTTYANRFVAFLDRVITHAPVTPHPHWPGHIPPPPHGPPPAFGATPQPQAIAQQQAPPPPQRFWGYQHRQQPPPPQ